MTSKCHMTTEVLKTNAEFIRCIGIGFGAQSAGLSSRPGMCEDTWGYHSEDGGIFNYPVGTTSYMNGTFGTGDVIGCCVDPTLGTAYFTKNNEKLGMAGS
jgi:Ran-binding protein 9/10